MSARPFQRITPTFQMVLNTEIKEMMDAINQGNLELAFVIGHTLVDALKPEDRERLLEDYINLVKARLERVGNGRLDFYVGGLGASKQQMNILHRNIRVIFMAIMETLHNGNYLEIGPAQARYKTDKKLSV